MAASLEAVNTHLQDILQNADLNTLSERDVREQMSNKFRWDASQLEEHKPLIKVGTDVVSQGLDSRI